MATIEERIESTAKKLQQLKARKQKAEQREKHKVKKAERAADTRKKILVGSYYLSLAEKSPDAATKIAAAMDGFLTRDDDRALFGLPTKTAAA